MVSRPAMEVIAKLESGESNTMCSAVAVERTLVPADPCLPPAACGDTSSEEAAREVRAKRKESYAKTLQEALQRRKDMVIDFTSLKACLDPLTESADNEEVSEFDYEEFLYDWFESGEADLPPLESLVVRNIKMTATGSKFDSYACFCHGIMQMSTLVQLDLGGNSIPDSLQSHLQLWNLQNLKRLNLDSTGLKAFPPSVGRLRKLEELSLANNQLSGLPATLEFCEQLKVLNLKMNKFSRIPAVVLHLENLEELKRLDNPLPPRWNGFEGFPHISASSTSAKTGGEKKTFNPDSLQMLCTKATFTRHLDYWNMDTIGPLQCKILDRLAAEFVVCENCHSVVPLKGFTVDVLLLTFLELRDVPFRLQACSERCQSAIKDKYTALQTELQRKMDAGYEEMMKQAHKLVKASTIDISPDALNVPSNQVDNFAPTYTWRASDVRRRRRKQCVIM